jgi:hypothetical protein
MKIHDPTHEGLDSSYQAISYEDFAASWASGSNRYGKAFGFYLIKTQNRSDTREQILADVAASHENKIYAPLGVASREALASYFSGELAATFRSSAAFFRSIGETTLNSSLMEQLKEIEQVAYETD